MEKLLSVVKNSEREVTIIIPLGQEITKILINHLLNATVTYDLTLTLYKVNVQKNIVCNFSGNKDSINNLIEHVEGLY